MVNKFHFHMPQYFNSGIKQIISNERKLSKNIFNFQASPKYDFDWSVKDDYSGNDFGHQETRDGYNTEGSYFVLLPDGRRQTVTYYVNGDSGFVAKVTYEGEARYHEPQTNSYRPQPTYKPQPPKNQYSF